MNSFNLIFTIAVLPLCLAISSCTQPTRSSTLKDDSLAPCPATPNCVCSEEASGNPSIAPLKFEGVDPILAWTAIQTVIEEGGGKIEELGEKFLHATYRSMVFRFTDDVTCRIVPEENIIHIRSASRVGFSDLGVNRRRVESIRKLLEEKLRKAALSQ